MRSWSAALAAGSLAVAACHAADTTDEIPPELRPRPLTETAAPRDWLPAELDAADRFQAGVSERFFDLLDRIDRFFGDERIEDDVRGSHLRLGIGVRWDRAEGESLQTRVRSRIDLPKTQQRLQLVLDNLTETADPRGRNPLDDTIEASRPDAAVRFIARETPRMRLSTDLGAKLGGDLQGFSRLRLRYALPLGPWELRLTQTAQWYTSDGFGTSSEMRWSRALSDGWIFRSSTRLRWEEKRDGVTPVQSFDWIRALSQNGHGHRVTLQAEWPETPRGGLASYGIEYADRRRIGPPWLLIEIAPGLAFREVRDFEPDPRIQIMFEALFGSL